MKHIITKKEKSAVEVKIILTKEEVTPIRKEAIDKITKTAEVPGFRKGHAPVATIESNFGKHIDEEIVHVALEKHYDSIVESEKLQPVSYIYNLTTAKNENEFEIVFFVDVFPEVKLGEYKGLKIEKKETEFKEENLTAEIEAILNRKATLVDCEEGYKAEMGDIIDLAFDGSIDGVPFDGGKADSHQLKLGSKMFIDTFEEQLVGYTKGQEGEVNVKFPDNYGHEPLAGKPAVFKVKINSIKKNIKPELTEELAKELGFQSIEELKTKTKEDLIKKEEEILKNDMIVQLLKQIQDSSEVELPNSMIGREVENKLKDMEQHLAMQGANMEMYLKMIGKTIEELRVEMIPMAANKVKTDILLDEIAKAEKLEATSEDMAVKMSEIAKMYGMDTAKLEEELKKENAIENFKGNLKVEIALQKAIDFILANSK